ncbi:hypothetical protein Vadar_015391 [Vaccinium darrowii]|uniref:Uncharacterized protein n=1 Tax=Vaccinium darrowii TaxID=229202 RepID=A0ACB7YDZ9_9ERIC|nr:hypothetical protein Vadar_015391 [Vaccinium darrowii]
MTMGGLVNHVCAMEGCFIVHTPATISAPKNHVHVNAYQHSGQGKRIQDPSLANNQNPKSPIHGNPPFTFKSHNPTTANPSPFRELHQVFQQEGNRLDSEERLSTIVRSLEFELQNSGIKVDCSELKTQLIRLKENHGSSVAPSAITGGSDQTLKVGFNSNPNPKGDQSLSTQVPIEDDTHLPQHASNQIPNRNSGSNWQKVRTGKHVTSAASNGVHTTPTFQPSVCPSSSTTAISQDSEIGHLATVPSSSYAEIVRNATLGGIVSTPLIVDNVTTANQEIEPEIAFVHSNLLRAVTYALTVLDPPNYRGSPCILTIIWQFEEGVRFILKLAT